MFDLLSFSVLGFHPLLTSYALVWGYFYFLVQYGGEHIWVLSSGWVGLDACGFFMSILNKCIFMAIIIGGIGEGRLYALSVYSLGIIVGSCFQLHSVVVFYVFFELTLLPMMLLLLGWGYQPERLSASKYLLGYTVFFSFPLLMYVLSSELGGGGMSFAEWRMCGESKDSGVLIGFLLSGFAVKIPVFGLHLWLPKAHVEASSGGSMVLAGVLLKLGGIGLWRMGCVVLGCGGVLDFLSGVALWGGVVVSLICVVQCDLKLLIAYSSVSHMSLVVWGFLSNTYLGSQGGVLMMAAHGFASSGLFFQAGLVYSSSGSRSLLLNQGMLSVVPGLMIYWFVLNCFSMGTPPSSNFLSEIEILSMSVVLSYWAWGSILVMAFFSVVYSMVAYTMTAHGRAGSLFRVSNQNGSFSVVLGFHVLSSVLLVGTFSGL